MSENQEKLKQEKFTLKNAFFIILIIAILSTGLYFTYRYLTSQPVLNICEQQSQEGLSMTNYLDHYGVRYAFQVHEGIPEVGIYNRDDCGNYLKEFGYTFHDIKNYNDEFKNRFISQIFDYYSKNPDNLPAFLNGYTKNLNEKILENKTTFFVNENYIEIRPAEDDTSDVKVVVNNTALNVPSIYKYGVENSDNSEHIFFLTIDLFEPMDRIAVSGNINPGFYRLNMMTGDIKEVNSTASTDYFSQIHANTKSIFISRVNYIDIYDKNGAFIHSLNLLDVINGEYPAGFVPNILHLDDNIIVFGGFKFNSDIIILSIDELLR